MEGKGGEGHGASRVLADEPRKMSWLMIPSCCLGGVVGVPEVKRSVNTLCPQH